MRPASGLAAAAASVLFAAVLVTPAASSTATQPTLTRAAAATAGGSSDVTRLDAALAKATREAEKLADELLQAASRAAGVRIAIDDAVTRQEQTRAAFEDRIRSMYMSGPADPVTTMLLELSGTDLATLRQGAGADARSDTELIAAVDAEAAEIATLGRRLDADRRALVARARTVYAAQDRARRLLAAAESAYANDRAKLAELAARRADLDEQARNVSVAATPAVTARGRRAAAAEAPIIAALEAAGSAFPPGYRATGRRLRGEASWYGPGFVGNPTATGAPYDPERFTAAMLAVPLGTVVRVTTADGRAINVLVNDRGPYAHGRIIDMSAAGARMLGFSGVKQVTVEVLEPLR